MPTGYTSILHEKDLSAKDFIMRCSRNFGATISMRDESLDVPIPEKFEISNFYKNKLEKNEKELNELRKMSDEEIALLAKQEYDKNYNYYSSEIQKNEKLINKLENLKSGIQEWRIGGDSQYNNLKSFAISQLNIDLESLNWSLDYNKKELIKLKIRDSREIYLELMSKAIERINSYKEGFNKEVKIVNERNEWLSGLRKELETIR